MTDPNYTAMLIVLDRSGSMSMIRDGIVGGLTELVREQATAPGLLTVDIVTFDNLIEYTHEFALPANVTIDLEPRGGTALYDAIGWSFNQFGQALAGLPEHARPAKVLVTIVTDGLENASVEYTPSLVRQLIVQQRDSFDGDVSFLGTNQDAVLEAQRIGINREDALDYGTRTVGASMSAHSAKLRRVREGDPNGYTDAERDAARGE